MASERLGIVEFGRRLIETEDLDPVYVAMYRAKLARIEIVRFTVAWLMYYHTGLGCQIAESPRMFSRMVYIAKHNDGFPRGSQRKHHRKEPAVKSALDLRKRFKTGNECLQWLIAGESTAREMFFRVCEWVGWGPCMAWRVPDIFERLGTYPALFVDSDVDLFFTSPKKGAILCAEMYGLDMETPELNAHLYLMEHLGHMKAPPRYERTINIQETETVFCKWKSHMSGHYNVGRDTGRARQGFEAYPTSELSRRLLSKIPRGPINET